MTATRKYALAWFGLMVVAILNGALRDLLYKGSVGEMTAHQISTVTLLILIGIFIRKLAKVWPIASVKQAWTIGGIWFVLTEAFEFGLGWMRGDSWERLFRAYNILAGELWILIPLWILVGPFVFHRFASDRGTAN